MAQPDAQPNAWTWEEQLDYAAYVAELELEAAYIQVAPFAWVRREDYEPAD